MWLELDDSIKSISNLSTTQCATLETIALSAFQGKHLLSGSSSVLDWMMNQELSQAARAACLYSKNRRAEIQSMKEVIKTKVTIVHSVNLFYSRNCREYTISLSMLEFGNINSILMTENLSDGKIYSLAAEHYRLFKRLSHPHKISHQGAGGSQIFPEFKNAVSERNGFILAITDTDKDHPKDTPNAVAKNCEKYQDQVNWVHLHFNLPARELENILPINLLYDAILSKPENKDLFEKIDIALDFSKLAPDHYIFSDLKIGVTGNWSNTQQGNPEKSLFWKNGLQKVNFRCVNTDCDKAPIRCECQIIPALGENMVSKFIDYLQGISSQKQLSRAQTSSNFKQWLEVGQTVFEWGLASPVSRS